MRTIKKYLKMYIYILYIHPEEREKVIDDFSLI